MQNHEKVVTVKPVASRPFSSFRSFSKLLEQSSSTSSPPVSLPEVTVASRPKTTRFRSPPSDPLAEVTVTTASDVDTTNEQMAAGMDQVLSGDHLTMPHDVMKPMGSVKKHSSYDGYNWRKYGQKQVKGSEFPRSYYKCTHPSCPVKRKVERSLDGQIAEIVYNGEHNHPKPHPPKKPFSSASTETAVTEAHATDDAVVDGELGGCSCTLGYDSVVVAFRGSCSCLHGFGEMSKKGDCKKSMKGKHSCDTSALTAYVEPTPASRRLTEHEMSGDGFHWRKYGRKVVKGNSFPRSYYRCTAEKCNARKYVERASDDSGSFVTIYEGKHNHDIPT